MVVRRVGWWQCGWCSRIEGQGRWQRQARERPGSLTAVLGIRDHPRTGGEAGSSEKEAPAEISVT